MIEKVYAADLLLMKVITGTCCRQIVIYHSDCKLRTKYNKFTDLSLFVDTSGLCGFLVIYISRVSFSWMPRDRGSNRKRGEKKCYRKETECRIPGCSTNIETTNDQHVALDAVNSEGACFSTVYQLPIIEYWSQVWILWTRRKGN